MVFASMVQYHRADSATNKPRPGDEKRHEASRSSGVRVEDA